MAKVMDERAQREKERQIEREADRQRQKELADQREAVRLSQREKDNLGKQVAELMSEIKQLRDREQNREVSPRLSCLSPSRSFSPLLYY